MPMKTAPMTSVRAEHRIHVGVEQRGGDVVADARPGEHRLDHHGAFEQPGVGQAEHRDQRHADRCRKACRQITSRSGTPLTRAVVTYSWRELVEHEAARHARDIGEAEEAEHRGRQHQMPERVPEDVRDRPRAGCRSAAGRCTGGTSAVIEDVDAAGPADPSQLGVEDQRARPGRARRPAWNSRAARRRG